MIRMVDGGQASYAASPTAAAAHRGAQLPAERLSDSRISRLFLDSLQRSEVRA
jgi:hypothetical protein